MFKVILPKELTGDIKKFPDLTKEMLLVENIINEQPELPKETLAYYYMNGYYNSDTSTLDTINVIVNNTPYSVYEISGRIRLKSKKEQIKIAHADIDFDYAFLGEVKPSEAVLFHLDFPVQGASNKEFLDGEDIVSSFSNVNMNIINPNNN